MSITKKSETRTFDGNVVTKATHIENSNGTTVDEVRVYRNTVLPAPAISITKTTGKIEKK